MVALPAFIALGSLAAVMVAMTKKPAKKGAAEMYPHCFDGHMTESLKAEVAAVLDDPNVPAETYVALANAMYGKGYPMASLCLASAATARQAGVK